MKKIAITGLCSLILLAGCGDDSKETAKDTNTEQEHAHMNHMDDGGVIPEGLAEAENPKFEVGSKAIIEADHMEGMNGAEATIVGAFDTTVYAVTYESTTDGEKVENHKWVIHEELEATDGKGIVGSNVMLNAKHMEGMDGAEAIIESSEDTTVYMIDYVSTTDGTEVKNHKWVTEDELSEAK
ncbi:YdhK family protein [Psychrobacillus sp. FSL W7-1493]|uniref:YdhK family protein n=1 Tax=Psychrobacillus sp. FSL W7-1493 TaxID=2921552 RepID=UPI0030F97F08